MNENLLIELTTLTDDIVFVNFANVLYLQKIGTDTRLHFVNGNTLDIKQTVRNVYKKVLESAATPIRFLARQAAATP